MAAPRNTKAKTAAVEEVDEVWAKLQTENHVPPLVVKHLTFIEPTKAQIKAWQNAETIEAGERALWGDLFDEVHALFEDEPVHVWENFNVLYLKHFFGTTGEDDLKG